MNETELTYLLIYNYKKIMPSMRSGAIKAVEVMINGSLTRLDNLKGIDREALYDEYKEWLEVDENNVISDGVLYCNYLG